MKYLESPISIWNYLVNLELIYDFQLFTYAFMLMFSIEF